MLHPLVSITLLLTVLSSTHIASAQAGIWSQFSRSCSSWEGQFGTTDGTHGTAILSAACFSSSGQSIQSSLNLNTCLGRLSDTTFGWPSSGMLDSCIVLNVPNSEYNPYSSDYSTTELAISCTANQPGVVYLLSPLDLNQFVGNNNGVLQCGFM